MPGIGESLAKKIWEIIDTGSLEKLEDFQSSEYIQTINLFGNIWGCGPTIAKQWYDQVRPSPSSVSSPFSDMQGYRTLDDVRQRAKLSENQQVGLKYYDEFLERIPRDEVAEIESIVSRTKTEREREMMNDDLGQRTRFGLSAWIDRSNVWILPTWQSDVWRCGYSHHTYRWDISRRSSHSFDRVVETDRFSHR